jgi:5-methylcytosine-specific restriction endonuclease McrA
MKPAPSHAQPTLARRQIPEWIGATPDSDIPKHVKLRIWDRYGGRCYRTGKKIRVGDKWQFDHIVAIRDDGEHREFNIAPILDAPHKAKTAAEASDRAHIDRMKAKHLGIYPPSKFKIRNRGFSRRAEG